MVGIPENFCGNAKALFDPAAVLNIHGNPEDRNLPLEGKGEKSKLNDKNIKRFVSKDYSLKRQFVDALFKLFDKSQGLVSEERMEGRWSTKRNEDETVFAKLHLSGAGRSKLFVSEMIFDNTLLDVCTLKANNFSQQGRLTEGKGEAKGCNS